MGLQKPLESDEAVVAALQTRPPSILTINTICDYLYVHYYFFTPLYTTLHHYCVSCGPRRREYQSSRSAADVHEPGIYSQFAIISDYNIIFTV